MKSVFKKAAVALLALPLVAGCAGQRGAYTMGGAGLGAAAASIFTGGMRDPVARGGAVLGGAILGGAAGSFLEPACVNTTTSSMSRGIYGNNTTQWNGNQTYNEECRGTGSQNIPGAQLPPSVQTNGFFGR